MRRVLQHLGSQVLAILKNRIDLTKIGIGKIFEVYNLLDRYILCQSKSCTLLRNNPLNNCTSALLSCHRGHSRNTGCRTGHILSIRFHCWVNSRECSRIPPLPASGRTQTCTRFGCTLKIIPSLLPHCQIYSCARCSIETELGL